ncbi:MAG: 6-bladed beta-propeller [Gallionella sp.]
MSQQLRFACIVICVALMATGCADAPKIFRYDNPDPGTTKVWPNPPEKARFGYVGELTGENNFRPETLEARGTAAKIFDWLTGDTNRNPDPVVLRRPQCGVVDAEGSVFVTDVSRAAVFVFDKPAGTLQILDSASSELRFIAPIGIALGNAGQILVADAELHSIFRLDRQGNPLGEFGRDILKRPTGLARDPIHGIVYVADTGAHNIKVFSDDGKLIQVFGHRGEGPGEFNAPTYLAFSSDKLYVTDTLNSRIQILDEQGKMISTFGKRGLYVGDLVRPKGVAVDNDGNIYVIESLYDNLLVFDQQGRTLLALGGTGKEAGEFYLPSGVWTDNQNQIYIADMFNGRITVLQFLGGSQ